MTFKRLAALFLLLVAGAWSALVNGGPFFFPDTSNYVRGPDFAVVYFLGKKFATSWTQERTLQGAEHPPSDAIAGSSAHQIRLNSPFDKAVMSGRSIYYGALLYVGHLTSNFWLSIFAQAAIFIYLSYTFVIKCARLSFFTFVCTTAIILVATPVSFFISFLTPDIFASFLILATIILVGFWSTLKLRDRVFVTAIILYSILVHTSHLLLLICIGLLAFVCFIFQRKTAVSSLILKPAIVLSAIILSGFLGELIFSYSTRLTIGTDPTRPPFVMARLIQDGPGYQFLQKNCATKHYVVCNYMDRLSIPSGFLWSTDPNEGVYNVADQATRIALSSEEVSFVLDVFRFDPIGVMTEATKSSIRQLLTVGVNEFFYDQAELQSYKERLPNFYFNGLLRSHISLQNDILAPINNWFSLIYFFSTIGLVLTCAFWPLVQFQHKLDIFPQPQWFYVLSISLMATFFNAAICGALAGTFPRYQTRISWIPLFVLCLIIAKVLGVFFTSKERAGAAVSTESDGIASKKQSIQAVARSR